MKGLKKELQGIAIILVGIGLVLCRNDICLLLAICAFVVGMCYVVEGVGRDD